MDKKKNYFDGDSNNNNNKNIDLLINYLVKQIQITKINGSCLFIYPLAINEIKNEMTGEGSRI